MATVKTATMMVATSSRACKSLWVNSGIWVRNTRPKNQNHEMPKIAINTSRRVAACFTTCHVSLMILKLILRLGWVEGAVGMLRAET